MNEGAKTIIENSFAMYMKAKRIEIVTPQNPCIIVD
jgi:hypothetical protein